MSTAATVRIARLDLKVEHRDLVHPFRNDLEDALRTAGLPHLPSGARLFIRRLRLGRIPAGLGRQALSRYLDAKLGTVDYVLALPEAAPAEQADAVLVPDLVTGAALALDAIEAGRGLPWYLQDLFPDLAGTSPGRAEARVLEILIAGAGPQAPGRLAETAGGGRRLLRLLAGLSDQNVRAVLAGFGEASTGLADLSDGLAAVPGGPDRVLAAPPPRPLPTGIVLDAILFHASPAARREITLAASGLPTDPERLGLLAVWLATARAGPSAVRAALARLKRALAGTGDAERSGRTRHPGPALMAPARHRTERGPGLPELPEPAAPSILRLARPPDRDETSSLLPEPSPLEGAFSDHAGLWLLLPALRLAGLDATEQATGLSLGHTLLSGFADRLGLGEADPARTCLAPDFDADPGMLRPWLPRADVLRLVSGGRDLRFTRSAPGKAVIGLRHGDGILAVAGPSEIHTLRAAGCGLHAAPRPVLDFSSALRRGLMLATQRLVSRTTGTGWRRLAARRGRIVVTPTHLDIEFDGRDADPAVRIAGLDLDPGWVPWLGRVVCFHYNYSRMRSFPTQEPRP